MNEIEKYIKKELAKYNWLSEYSVISTPPFYKVVFETIVIVFYLNEAYSSIECYIKKSNDDDSDYTLSDVLKYSGIEDNSYWNYSDVEIESYIIQYIEIISNKLIHVLKGDISWKIRIDAIRENTTYIQREMGTTFIFDTDIYKKMIAQDSSWKKDLVQWKGENQG